MSSHKSRFFTATALALVMILPMACGKRDARNGAEQEGATGDETRDKVARIIDDTKARFEKETPRSADAEQARQKVLQTLDRAKARLYEDDDDSSFSIEYSDFVVKDFPESQFKIGFLSEPSVDDAAVGKLYLSGLANPTSYSVSVVDLPRPMPADKANAALKRVLDSKLVMFKEFGAKLVKSKRELFRGHPAISYEYKCTIDDEETHTVGVDVVIGKRLYCINVSFPADERDEARCTEFIDSFVYTGK